MIALCQLCAVAKSYKSPGVFQIIMQLKKFFSKMGKIYTLNQLFLPERVYLYINLNNMNSGKLILGILAGAAAGALLGVLFAPEKGSETRRKISQKGKDLVDDVKHKYDDFVKGVSEKFDSVKQEAEYVKTKASKVADTI
jgi:gas vesicle protein